MEEKERMEKGKERKGKEVKGREGKGRERKGKEGKGKEGKGKEGEGKEGKGKKGKGKEVKAKSRLKVSLLGGMKRPTEKSNSDLNDYKEANNNRGKLITLSYDARGKETIASRHTREWRHHILGRSVLKDFMESLENVVDLAELDTNHEQGRKEHQDGASVLVRDEGSLAPDGVDVGGQEDHRRNDDRVVVPCVFVVETFVGLGNA